jgi:hypothetical protein
LLRFAMLLISPCAVVVCGPRWALPQLVLRLVIRAGCPTFTVCAGCPAVVPVIPAVPPVVVIGFPDPTPKRRW